MHVGVAVRALCGEKKVLSALCFFKKIVKTFVKSDIQQVPVVQPCAFELAVVDLESQRFHQMKRRACRRAGTCDVARVLRDFRLDEDKFEF